MLPRYRFAFLNLVADELGPKWRAFAGMSHLDTSVRTDVPTDLFTPVVNRRLIGGRVLLQQGHWRAALTADVLVIDLNPRSLTAWGFLVLRKALGRRTLVWGHLHPRKGPASSTARIRDWMRRLAHGTVVYTYASAEELGARHETSVWVAPNAVFKAETMEPRDTAVRDAVLYVGRLEPEKKPRLLLEAFRIMRDTGRTERLLFVGEGSLRSELERAAEEFGLADVVTFVGPCHDPDDLAALYGAALCSVSPGFVGLSLTQSLGFGVPMVIADNESHSPEIELARTPHAAVFFSAGSAEALAEALSSEALHLTQPDRDSLASYIRATYSAEAMAAGLVAAVRNEKQDRGRKAGRP